MVPVVCAAPADWSQGRPVQHVINVRASVMTSSAVSRRRRTFNVAAQHSAATHLVMCICARATEEETFHPINWTGPYREAWAKHLIFGQKRREWWSERRSAKKQKTSPKQIDFQTSWEQSDEMEKRWKLPGGGQRQIMLSCLYGDKSNLLCVKEKTDEQQKKPERIRTTESSSFHNRNWAQIILLQSIAELTIILPTRLFPYIYDATCK